MKKNQIIGIIGGLVLGYIFAIPWILTALYVNLFVAYLAVPVGIGVYYGYKLFSKPDDDTPIIITIISLFIIISITVVIIPGIKLNSVGIPITIDNIISLYNISGLIINLLLSIFIGYIGISNSTGKVYKDLEKTSPFILNHDAEILNTDIKQTVNSQYPGYENIKAFFVSKNATSVETAISHKELKEYRTAISKNFEIVDFMSKKIIKVVKGKYYFDLDVTDEDINNKEKATNKIGIIVAVILIIIISILSKVFNIEI